MILSLTNMKSLFRISHMPVLLFGLLLAGCSEQSGVYDAHGDSNSGFNMGHAPAMLTRAVELSQLRPIVTMNGLTVEPERLADGSWFVDYTLFDSALELGVTWVENFEGQDLVLATYSSSFGDIMSNSSFTVPVADYVTEHDIDNDGVTNLQERVNNTDPYTSPIPNADAQGVWITDCFEDDEGNFVRTAVTFGPTAYQLSVIVYPQTVNCQGEIFISGNIIGTYVISGEVSELADGTTAKHLDISHTNGTFTASTALNAQLAASGSSLAEFFAAQGVPNINDVPIETFDGAPEKVFSIYRVIGNRFITGAPLGSQDGTTAERRHVLLAETDQFIKQ